MIEVRVYTVYGKFVQRSADFIGKNASAAEAFLEIAINEIAALKCGFLAEMIYVNGNERQMIKLVMDRSLTRRAR